MSMDDMEHDHGLADPYSALDPDGTSEAVLLNAPPHMEIFYDLIKTAHDSNAAALAELKAAHSSNAALLAENSHVLAETTHALISLATRVNVVEQSQQALATRVDADLTEVRANVSRVTAANSEHRNHRSLEDTRQIIVRGIPSVVCHEPLPLATALLSALKLERYVSLVVS